MRRVVEYSTFFFPQRVPEKDGHYWGFVREAERRGRKIVRLARQRVPRGGAAHPTALVPGKPGHTRGSYQLLFSLATWRIEKDKKESVGKKIVSRSEFSILFYLSIFLYGCGSMIHGWEKLWEGEWRQVVGKQYRITLLLDTWWLMQFPRRMINRGAEEALFSLSNERKWPAIAFWARVNRVKAITHVQDRLVTRLPISSPLCLAAG